MRRADPHAESGDEGLHAWRTGARGSERALAGVIAENRGGGRRGDRRIRRAGPSKPFETYPGSKDAAGSAERIIHELPPHSVYVEAFIGGGAVFRRKVPALCSIAIDRDADVVARWRRCAWPGLDVLHGCAIRWLSTHGRRLPKDALVYCDPPYLRLTRSRKRLYGPHELDADGHARLLEVLIALPCSVAVSGYGSSLYSAMLASWRCVSWPAMTRGGPRTEHLWVRSTIAGFGGAARYPGANFRERERIKRRVVNWSARYSAMLPGERQAVLGALLSAERALRPAFGDPAPPDSAVRSSSPRASRSSAMRALR